MFYKETMFVINNKVVVQKSNVFFSIQGVSNYCPRYEVHDSHTMTFDWYIFKNLTKLMDK